MTVKGHPNGCPALFSRDCGSAETAQQAGSSMKGRHVPPSGARDERLQ